MTDDFLDFNNNSKIFDTYFPEYALPLDFSQTTNDEDNDEFCDTKLDIIVFWKAGAEASRDNGL